MANKDSRFYRKCCLRNLFSLIKQVIPIFIIHFIGWALFSYIEDSLNVLGCIANSQKVAEEPHPSSNKTERALILFSMLYNKTGQALTTKQQSEILFIFRRYFNVPKQEAAAISNLNNLGCSKWLRFSIMTSTTIGKRLNSLSCISYFGWGRLPLLPSEDKPNSFMLPLTFPVLSPPPCLGLQQTFQLPTYALQWKSLS